MKVNIDIPILIISLVFFIPGFALIWHVVGFWCALGVFLVGLGFTVKRI